MTAFDWCCCGWHRLPHHPALCAERMAHAPSDVAASGVAHPAAPSAARAADDADGGVLRGVRETAGLDENRCHLAPPFGQGLCVRRRGHIGPGLYCTADSLVAQARDERDAQIEQGICSACAGPIEGHRDGAWWHLYDPCRSLQARAVWSACCEDGPPGHTRQQHHDASPACVDPACDLDHPFGGPYPHPCASAGHVGVRRGRWNVCLSCGQRFLGWPEDARCPTTQHCRRGMGAEDYCTCDRPWPCSGATQRDLSDRPTGTSAPLDPS